MGLEAVELAKKPAPLDACPGCGVRPFDPFLRGMVGRSPWPWWAWLLPLKRWRRPTFAVICWSCKEIVGYEDP